MPGRWLPRRRTRCTPAEVHAPYSPEIAVLFTYFADALKDGDAAGRWLRVDLLNLDRSSPDRGVETLRAGDVSRHLSPGSLSSMGKRRKPRWKNRTGYTAVAGVLALGGSGVAAAPAGDALPGPAPARSASVPGVDRGAPPFPDPPATDVVAAGIPFTPRKGARTFSPQAPVSGIPRTVLAAYTRSTSLIAHLRPNCRLPLSLLAAIGRVESAHAAGGDVDRAGTTRNPIVGPRLDGSPGVAAIRDTDGGRYDLDAAWDRAVGPMQFIPSTWRAWAADGNGDGTSSPHNVFDAALAAGSYLCADGRDLSRPGDVRTAILSYNHSQQYLQTVLAWMRAYDGGPAAIPDRSFGQVRSGRRVASASPQAPAGQRNAGSSSPHGGGTPPRKPEPEPRPSDRPEPAEPRDPAPAPAPVADVVRQAESLVEDIGAATGLGDSRARDTGSDPLVEGRSSPNSRHPSLRLPALTDPCGDLGARSEAELGEEVLDVALGRPLRDHHFDGDLLVRQRVRHETGDLRLPTGQRGAQGARCRRGRGWT